jgi:transposase-like protein
MGIFNRGNHKGAYSGSLSCPVCHSTAIRYVENIGPYRQRYRCRKCGLPFQYETGREFAHPYAPFNKGNFRGIVDQFGRNLKAKEALEKLS